MGQISCYYKHIKRNQEDSDMSFLLLAIATVLYMPLYIIFGLTKRYK